MKSLKLLEYLDEQIFPWIDAIGIAYSQFPQRFRQTFLRSLMNDLSQLSRILGHAETLTWQSSCYRLEPFVESSLREATNLMETLPQFDPDIPHGYKQRYERTLVSLNRVSYAYLLSIAAPNGQVEFNCWCEYFYIAQTIAPNIDRSFTAALILRSESLLGIKRVDCSIESVAFEALLSELAEIGQNFVAESDSVA